MSIHGIPAAGRPVSPATGGAGTQPAGGVQPQGPDRLPQAASALSPRALHGGPHLHAASAPRNARLPVRPVPVRPMPASQAAARMAAPDGASEGTGPAGSAAHLPAAEPKPERDSVPAALHMQEQMNQQMNQQMAWQMQMQIFTTKQGMQQKLTETITGTITAFGDAMTRLAG